MVATVSRHSSSKEKWLAGVGSPSMWRGSMQRCVESFAFIESERNAQVCA